jgi:hypothetical protein
MKYTLAERILIVPLAHVRIMDVRFQTEMYELFHRTTGARLGHLCGTPIVLFGLFMLAAQAPWVAAIALASGLFALVVLWAFVVDRLVGALAAAGSLALAAGAFATVRLVNNDGFVIGVAATLGGCAVQTFSHLFEDVPPPQSGTERFVPIGAWIRTIGAVEMLRSTALTFLVFYWLELWAAPRVWPLQILHLAMRAGYRPDLRGRLDDRVATILASPEGTWRRG